MDLDCMTRFAITLFFGIFWTMNNEQKQTKKTRSENQIKQPDLKMKITSKEKDTNK